MRVVIADFKDTFFSIYFIIITISSQTLKINEFISLSQIWNTDYKKDIWRGRQVWITGFASKEKENNQMKAVSLKVDPFSKCVEIHNIENYPNADVESTAIR